MRTEIESPFCMALPYHSPPRPSIGKTTHLAPGRRGPIERLSLYTDRDLGANGPCAVCAAYMRRELNAYRAFGARLLTFNIDS